MPRLQYDQYPRTPLVQPWEEAKLMIDLRVGLKELLGLPLNLISEDFLTRLDSFVGGFRDRPYLLSPGARVLQGVMLVDGPFRQMPHMSNRVRGLCVLITALEALGRELEGATPHDDTTESGNSTDGKGTLGKNDDIPSPKPVPSQTGSLSAGPKYRGSAQDVSPRPRNR